MQTIIKMREAYEQRKEKRESAVLRFFGVDGRDVYNCSVPFEQDGKKYILGRVEARDRFACSVTYLFEEGADGAWYKVESFDALPIEDPCYTKVNGEIVVIGTHVVKERGRVKTYYGYFFRGKDIFHLEYFTTGPKYMKDIRLVQLPENKIGVFSRPRCEKTKALYGSESMVGFTIVSNLDELTAERIENAPYLQNFFEADEWGGVNQAFWLGDNWVGAIGHQSYTAYDEAGAERAVYLNTAYLVDINKNEVLEKKVIATRGDYPETPCKLKGLCDCAFTSGIVDETQAIVRLYSGLSDAGQGWVEIENPFSAYLVKK